mgnify:CR=1 FL=1
MKLSSLLSIYNGPDAKYDAKHILFALSHAFGIELRPFLRGRMSVSIVNYRFYDDVSLVLKGCCTELNIVVR